MMIRSTFTCLLLAFGTVCTNAQIAFGGRPLGIDGDPILPSPAIFDFPEVDAARLMAEDEAQAAIGTKGPFRFGVNHDADLSIDNSGTWTTIQDGTRVWRLTLHCPEAKSINFIFGEFDVPEGARVFVWNEAQEILGAFTNASAGNAGSLGVAQLAGERVTVQYEEAAGMSAHASLRITQVTHGYRGFGSDRGLGDSGSCNNNVVCPEGDPWRDQIASVAMIVVNGNGYCTGQLINNCANDGTPYFLTANHCLAGQNPTNWTFRFNWESPACTPTTAGPTDNTVSGATLLENDPVSDVALLLLSTTPPASYDVWYTGWDATGAVPEATTVIHHPTGDVKKISFDNDAPGLGEFDGADCWHILTWEDGTTEGGSSGSGLWNPEGRLIGQLFGGEANCSNNVNDNFGRFDLSQPLLTQWLGNCVPAVLDGYDPNTPALALDASILNITGVQPHYCNAGSLSPVLTIRNNGTSALTQLTIAYGVDNNAPNTFDWSGNLATGGTTTVPLPELTAGSGMHVLDVSCSAPNGGTDGYALNDHMSRSFHVANPGETITLTINTDDYGSETTWSVESAGTPIYSGGPYTDVSGGSTETVQFCLEEACFVFTITDAYGDGICCGYGDGHYLITDSDGGVLLDGNGNFGASATTLFCTGFAGISEPEGANLLVYPDPSTGLVNVSLPRSDGNVSITVRDLLGRELMRTRKNATGPFMLDLSDLPNGRYLLDAISAERHLMRSVTIAR